MAVISLSAIAYSESVRVAGDEANEAIVRFMQKKHHLSIGENTAEDIKITIGSAYLQETRSTYKVRGKDLLTGVPRMVEVTDLEIKEALLEPVQVIVDAVRRALEKTAPELAADIYDAGMTVAGGGALLKGLDKLLVEETQLKINMAEDPLATVVIGTGIAMENFSSYKKVFVN